MKTIFIATLIYSILFLSGCAIHKVDVQQGNITDTTLIKQLKLGMNKKQIKFILGEPLVTSAFSNNNWSYIYYSQPGDGSRPESKHLSLLFENDTLAQIKNR